MERSLFEYEGEQFNLLLASKIGNFWSDNYIEYKSNGDRNKTILVKEYLNKSRPYLKDLINDLKKSDTWKNQLTVTINFISFKDNYEGRVTHSKSDNLKVMINDKTEEGIEELFDSLVKKYQTGLKKSMRVSNSYLIVLIYLIINVIKNSNRGEYNIDSPDWIKNKEATNNKSYQ